MRPPRDRQRLVWTMAAIGLGSLLAGAAMQTEPLRAICGCGTVTQAGPSEDCVRDRMAEAMARAQLAATGRVAQEDRPETGNSSQRPVAKVHDPAQKSPTEPSVPPPPPERLAPERPKS
jgi:hypothetical protein